MTKTRAVFVVCLVASMLLLSYRSAECDALPASQLR